MAAPGQGRGEEHGGKAGSNQRRPRLKLGRQPPGKPGARHTGEGSGAAKNGKHGAA
jgi:hypothetical protein